MLQSEHLVLFAVHSTACAVQLIWHDAVFCPSLAGPGDLDQLRQPYRSISISPLGQMGEAFS